MSHEKKHVTVTIEVPEIVASVLEHGIATSTKALIVPDAHYPGWEGRIVRTTRVGTSDFRPGDLAEHRSEDLDPREVVSVGRDFLTLDILGTETGRFPRDNYTVYTEAEGAL